MKPQCKTAAACLRELARVMDQFGMDDLEIAIASQFVKYGYKNFPRENRPKFDDPTNWQFALAEIEGKPVFLNDALWDTDGIPCKAIAASNNSRILVEYNDLSTFWFAQSELSWNPPKPKTVTVEYTIEEAKRVIVALEDYRVPGAAESAIVATKKALEELK